MIKRMLDFIVAATALLMLATLIVIIAGLIWRKLGAPVLFHQTRPGIWGKPFRMHKFRTMTESRGEDGRLLPDKDRLTPLGSFLRASSLDELPELWNVLTGDMSLVGPRPLLAEYLPLYTREQARRHEVRPGITGWAQVNGRNSLSWEQKFELDVWYVDNATLLLDARILLMTLDRVIRRDGIFHDGEATMAKFTGTKG